MFTQSEKKAQIGISEIYSHYFMDVLDQQNTSINYLRKARLQNQLGAAMLQTSSYPKALVLFTKASDHFNQYLKQLKELQLHHLIPPLSQQSQNTKTQQKPTRQLNHGEKLILKHDFNFSNLYYHIASTYASMKNYSDSIQFYIKCIETSPFTHIKSNEQFDGLKSSSSFKPAGLKFNSLQALIQAYSNLGVILTMQEKFLSDQNVKRPDSSQNLLSVAQEAFKMSIKLDPTNSDSHINLGNVLRQIGQRQLAIQHVWNQIEYQISKERLQTFKFQRPFPIILKSSNCTLEKAPQYLNIFCVKFGTKYGADYVNKLYNGIVRNVDQQKVKINFYCFTQNDKDLKSQIKIIKLDGALSGWWAKAHIFRAKELGFSGRVMYIDLDMVITGDLMNLFRYDGDFALLSTDQIYCETASKQGYNSSIIMFPTQIGSYIYDVLIKWKDYLLKYIIRFDHFLEMMVQNADFLQNIFKDQITDYMFMKTTQKKNCKESIVLPKNTKIVSFPRSPKPHQCEDQWIKQFWI